MPRIEHRIHIDATPAAVWDVLTDVERWPEWTPTMRRVERLDEGPLRLGSRARVTARGVPATPWRVVEYSDGRSFAWQPERGLSPVAAHTVAPDGAGSSVTLSVTADGPGAVFWPFTAWLSRRNLPVEADGLKRRCEQPPDGA